MVKGARPRRSSPWEFMQELPGVDELVVLLLRDEIIEDDGGVRRTPGQDEELLRAIVTAYPALGPTVDALAASAARAPAG